MSLFEQMMEPCRVMNKIRTSDGEGGFITNYTEGAKLKAAIINDTSTQARIAESQGVSSTYTITTYKANALDFHDVIKRESDGAYFRITSRADDKKSPDMATFDICQVSAERWTMPNE